MPRDVFKILAENLIGDNFNTKFRARKEHIVYTSLLSSQRVVSILTEVGKTRRNCFNFDKWKVTEREKDKVTRPPVG